MMRPKSITFRLTLFFSTASTVVLLVVGHLIGTLCEAHFEEMDLEEAESVGGLVMEKLGEIPHEGQKIPFAQFDVVVKKMNGPRIVLLRVYPRRNAVEETGV